MFRQNSYVTSFWNIDREPAPKGFLSAIVSEKPGEEFFYNKEYLSKFNNTSKLSDVKYPDMPILIELRPFLSCTTKGDIALF